MNTRNILLWLMAGVAGLFFYTQALARMGNTEFPRNREERASAVFLVVFGPFTLVMGAVFWVFL